MKELFLIAAVLFQALSPAQTRTGVVTGQLLSRDGQPAVGVRVTAMAVPDPGLPISNASTLVSVVLTDNAGRYRLENVPPGRYYVTAGLVELPTYYPGVSFLSGATTVNVAAGATVTGINFTMVVPVGVTVSGRVIFPPTQSISGRQMVLIGGGNPSQETTLNADGSFQFLKVRPGTYNLLVPSSISSQPFNVVVGDKDIAGLEIVVPLTIPVTGTVGIEGGGPHPRFSLSFASFKGGVTAPNSTMMPQGAFRAQLPEGEYRLAWSALPGGYTLKSITAGSLDLLANPLKITAGASPDPIVVTLGVTSPPPWVKVSGKVIGPVPYQMVLASTSGTGLLEPLSVLINPDGSFEFPKVLPGNYTARFVTPVLPIPPTSLVVGNRDMSGVEIVLPPMKEVSGRVTIEGPGQIPPRLSFMLTDPSGTAPWAALPLSDGTFSVTLPEGERRVALNVPGYSVKSLSYGSVDLLRDPSLKLSGSGSAQFQVTLMPAAAGVVGGIVGGVLTQTLYRTGTSSSAPPPLPAPQRVAGEVAQANLISSPQPAYPAAARQQRLQGSVNLSVIISTDGTVETATVVSGEPVLADAAVEAVRQWRYRPQTLNGQPIRVQTTVIVTFSFQ